jgi:hypothetical protein
MHDICGVMPREADCLSKDSPIIIAGIEFDEYPAICGLTKNWTVFSSIV